ncbi:MAG: helix-turn-helix domain-containing protein [Planctomycetota bacterium]
MEIANNPQRRLTVAEVAERLAINTTKVGRLIKAGELRAIDVSYCPDEGKPRWRIPLDALAEFEEARSSKPKPPPTNRRRALPRASREYV